MWTFFVKLFSCWSMIDKWKKRNCWILQSFLKNCRILRDSVFCVTNLCVFSHLPWMSCFHICLGCVVRKWQDDDFLTFRLSWTWFPTTWPSSIPGSSCWKKEIIQICIPPKDFYSIQGSLFHFRTVLQNHSLFNIMFWFPINSQLQFWLFY